MKLGHKVTTLVLVIGLSFTGGWWAGYNTACKDADPQRSIETVFTPEQDGLAVYLSRLEQARHSVHIACYGFTEPSIVDKLIELKNRGVTVRLLLDRSQSRNKYQSEQIRRLRAAGIEVVIGTSSRNGQIMHHKFTVIDGILVIDGSWNYSRSATKQANLLNFIASSNRARLFLEEWERMHRS